MNEKLTEVQSSISIIIEELNNEPGWFRSREQAMDHLYACINLISDARSLLDTGKLPEKQPKITVRTIGSMQHHAENM